MWMSENAKMWGTNMKETKQTPGFKTWSQTFVFPIENLYFGCMSSIYIPK